MLAACMYAQLQRCHFVTYLVRGCVSMQDHAVFAAYLCRYDFLFDVPHTDRFGRYFNGTWVPMRGETSVEF